MPSKKLDKITIVVIHLFCKPVRSPQEVVAYVFKELGRTLHTITAIQKVYPNTKHLFRYRDIKTMANAF